MAESESDIRTTTDTPYLALTGELWSVYCEDGEKNDRVITTPHCIWIEYIPNIPRYVGITQQLRAGAVVGLYMKMYVHLQWYTYLAVDARLYTGKLHYFVPMYDIFVVLCVILG